MLQYYTVQKYGRVSSTRLPGALRYVAKVRNSKAEKPVISASANKGALIKTSVAI